MRIKVDVCRRINSSLPCVAHQYNLNKLQRNNEKNITKASHVHFNNSDKTTSLQSYIKIKHSIHSQLPHIMCRIAKYVCSEINH